MCVCVYVCVVCRLSVNYSLFQLCAIIIIIFQNCRCCKHHIEAQDHHYVQAIEKARQDLILSETMIIMIIRIVTALLIQFMFF